jgi:hypothetical protein
MAARGVELLDKSILPAWLTSLAQCASSGWGIFGLKSDPPRLSAMIMSRDSVLIDAKAPRDGLRAGDLGGGRPAGVPRL